VHGDACKILSKDIQKMSKIIQYIYQVTVKDEMEKVITFPSRNSSICWLVFGKEEEE